MYLIHVTGAPRANQDESVKHRKHSTDCDIRNNAHVGSKVLLDQYGISAPHVGVSGFKFVPRYRLLLLCCYLLTSAGLFLNDAPNKSTTISVHNISNSLFPNHWTMYTIIILSYKYYRSLLVGSLIVSDKLLSIMDLHVAVLG